MNTIREIIITEINNYINHDGEFYFVNDGSGTNSFPANHLNKIRQIYNISKDNEILSCYKNEFLIEGDFFTATRNFIYSFLILEDGLYLRKIVETSGWDKEPDFVEFISWEDIENMELWFNTNKETQEKEYFIKLYKSNCNDIVEIPTELFGYFIEDDEENGNFIIEMLSNIKNKIDEFEISHYDNLNQIFDDIKLKVENNENEKALEIIKANFDLNSLINTDLYQYYFIVYYTSLCLKKLGENKEAIKLLEDRIQKSDDSDGFKEWGSWIINLKAEINENLGNYYSSLQDYYISYNNSNNLERKSILKEKISFVYSKYTETFSKLNYDERKMILVYDEIKVSPSNSFIVLDKTKLPNEIKFPLSHPKKEEIYIGHPYIKESYLPFSTYEASLFNDRFEEFSYFVQCLGAKSMTIKVIKENEKTITDEETSKIEGSIEFGKKVVKNSINGSYENSKDTEQKEDTKTSRVRTQIYNPVKKPYIPENLLWYPHETSWHRLYQQRVNGNILKHHDIISSKSSHSISSNEKSNLKLALKNFFAEININRDSLIESTINESESIEWEILVEFESIENLIEYHQENTKNYILESSSTSKEEQFKEEILFMLEDDGIIDDKERRILNRLGDKLGISLEKAKEIENKILSIGELNNNEKEYLEEFKEFLNDGEITEKERRILNRFATRLEITNERVIEIENSIK